MDIAAAKQFVSQIPERMMREAIVRAKGMKWRRGFERTVTELQPFLIDLFRWHLERALTVNIIEPRPAGQRPKPVTATAVARVLQGPDRRHSVVPCPEGSECAAEGLAARINFLVERGYVTGTALAATDADHPAA